MGVCWRTMNGVVDATQWWEDSSSCRSALSGCRRMHSNPQTSLTNLGVVWAAWGWDQQQPEAKMGPAARKEPVTGRQGKGHQCIGSCSFHKVNPADGCVLLLQIEEASRQNCSSYQMVSSWRAKQLPLCMWTMTSIYQQVLARYLIAQLHIVWLLDASW